MKKELSRNSLANRRLCMKNVCELVSFAAPEALAGVQLGQGFTACELEPLKEDIVSRGKQALRLLSDGRMKEDMSFAWAFFAPVDLSARPMVFFAFSAYDGEHDSQYFKNVSENMYFVEKPDPLLVSVSYLTLRLFGGGRQCERTVQLTNYGFNTVYMNFSGEELLKNVERMEFVYYIDETVPAWQRVCKLDTVFAGMAVDFTFKGCGMETLFCTENGTAEHRDGVLTYRFGVDSSLRFPDLTDAAETVCSVFLPVKNTVVARVSADRDELPLRLFFKTDADDTFTADKSKLFTLHGAKKEQTVYWNLSDLPACAGRLTGLKLAPACADGVLYIRKIAFEQEKKLQKNAGVLRACTSDGETIRFLCEAAPAYEGCEVMIAEIYPHVHEENPDKLDIIARAVLRGGRAELTASYRKEKITRIASQFLAFVRLADGKTVRLGERTLIENWRELCGGNPYEFALPAREVRVTDAIFGALGDGFTDDTKAIQTAIDTVAEQGGGRVTVPGDDSFYGRRYVATNLVLRSGVDLHLEKGAVLWQADDISYYAVLPRFGHNVAMTGVNWPANHSSGNFPFIYAFRQNHVKITGGGTLRLCDTESASEDGLFTYIGDNVCIGCTDRMHVAPVGVIECTDYELSDFSILRSSGVNMSLICGRRGFIGNVQIDEVKCTGADGLWPSGSNGIKITRLVLNNNDDGICLSTTYNDPRDVLWEYAYPGDAHRTEHIEISHSYLHCYTFTASAISFCTWGTDAPDLERHEVRDIEIFDTSLEGRASIGGWTDNPYYGVSPFDASEKDDFSPVNNISVHDCELQSPLSISPLRITNFRNDFGYKSPSDFEYGDFQRRPAERNPGWRAGLSNWSYSTRAAVEQVLLYGEPCALLKPVFAGACDLWQGLYLEAGDHRFCFKSKAAGTFTVFIRDGKGCTLASAEITEQPGSYIKGRSWNEHELAFHLPASGLYEVGFLGTFEKTLAAYLTGCHLR